MSPQPSDEIVVVVETFGTLYESPALFGLIPALFVALITILLVLRRRYSGLTPILIGVSAVPVAFLVLIVIGQAALVVAE